MAVFSAVFTDRFHRHFAATQSRMKPQRAPARGGSHVAGSLSLFDRFELADTARSEPR